MPTPFRPTRTPDLDLNLEHVNVSKDSLRPGTNSGSHSPHTPTESSSTSELPNRQSYMSNMTGATDFLNEAPTIITPSRGAVRQVLGVAQAQVVQSSTGSLTSSTPNSPRHPSSLVSRPSVRSPLATTSFGPKDVVTEAVSEADEDGVMSIASDPFADERSFNAVAAPASHIRGGDEGSITTFSTESSLGTPVPISNQRFRPVSLETNAASILSANIGTAARVQVGLSPPRRGDGMEDVPTTATSMGLGTPRMLTRMASGRLVTPSTANTASTSTPTGAVAVTQGSGSSVGTLQEQQARALAHAQAKAREANLGLGPDAARRTSSGSSVISGRDSILENFPFVPPSPISARPARSPPHSPLRQQSFTNSQAQSSATPTQVTPQSGVASADDLPKPPNRKLLAMSTVSQSSTASEGLGSFPFHIEREPSDTAAKVPPTAYAGRTRASLDTLALTSALSSYPLGFDEASANEHPMPR
jgi:protein OPY2